MHVQILFDGTVVRGKFLKIVYALGNMNKMPIYVKSFLPEFYR